MGARLWNREGQVPSNCVLPPEVTMVKSIHVRLKREKYWSFCTTSWWVLLQILKQPRPLQETRNKSVLPEKIRQMDGIWCNQKPGSREKKTPTQNRPRGTKIIWGGESTQKWGDQQRDLGSTAVPTRTEMNGQRRSEPIVHVATTTKRKLQRCKPRGFDDRRSMVIDVWPFRGVGPRSRWTRFCGHEVRCWGTRPTGLPIAWRLKCCSAHRQRQCARLCIGLTSVSKENVGPRGVENSTLGVPREDAELEQPCGCFGVHDCRGASAARGKEPPREESTANTCRPQRAHFRHWEWKEDKWINLQPGLYRYTTRPLWQAGLEDGLRCGQAFQVLKILTLTRVHGHLTVAFLAVTQDVRGSSSFSEQWGGDVWCGHVCAVESWRKVESQKLWVILRWTARQWVCAAWHDVADNYWL